MPAVTPAEVHTLPSRTKIGSGSTVTSGYVARQLVARRASASSRAGRRAARPPRARTRRCTPTRRAGCGAPARRIHADELAVVRRGLRAPSPPTTTSVSMRPADRRERPVGDDRQARGWSRAGPASWLATSTRYASGSRPVRRATSRRGREHLVRPDQVERGDARVGDEHDAAAHRPIVRAGRLWQQ